MSDEDLRWTLSDLSELARARSGDWETASFWDWVEATAWIASRDAHLMSLVYGGRAHFGVQEHVGSANARFACRTLLVPYVGEDVLALAESRLRGWCEDGSIVATSNENDSPVRRSDWIKNEGEAARRLPFVSVPSADIRVLAQGGSCKAPSGDGSRGILPATAKAADRRYEPFAHEAADLVRKGAKLSDAIRQVAPPMPPLAESSVEHGIRRTFGKIYDADGRAILP